MKDNFDKAKDLAQIMSLIAVPLLVAFFGYLIQSSNKDREIKRDYVKMSISILSNPNADDSVKTWATRVLKENSPTPFDAMTGEKLSQAFSYYPAALPSLPQEAKASTVSVPEICSDGCSRGVSQLFDKSTEALNSGSVANNIDALGNILNRLLETAGQLATYADQARIAGLTCERSYDAVRALQSK